jgi:DNA-binding NarL/FixJ family response regulator
MVLEMEHPGRPVREAGSLDDVLELAAAAPDAMAIIDLDMPGMDGAESLRALRQAFPALVLAVLTGNADRAMILDALDAGVNGYMLKASPSDELVYAVTTMLGGRIYVAGRFAGAAVPLAPRPIGPPAAAKHHMALTPREHEVLVCLMKGQSNKQIARALGIGEGTVKVHLAGVFRCLGAQNRTEAVLIAVDRGVGLGVH